MSNGGAVRRRDERKVAAQLSALAGSVGSRSSKITVDPNQTYPFAVGDGADVKGMATARAKDLSKNWPPAPVDCALGQLVAGRLPALPRRRPALDCSDGTGQSR